MPSDATGPIRVLAADDSTLAIRLPRATAGAPGIHDEDIVTYDAGDGSVSVPLVNADGSIQLTTVIDSPTAPTRYTYDFGMGVQLEAEGTGVIVRAADDNFLGVIQAPWAHDADGTAVQTRFVLNGSLLTQIVEHSAMYSYPVVADPAFCGKLFTAIVTTTENSQPRYKLYRSTCGISVSTGAAFGGGAAGLGIGQQVMLAEGWADAKTLVPALTLKATLRQQYDCHVFYAFAKPDSWNLEKWRPNKSDWGSSALSHLCNWS